MESKIFEWAGKVSELLNSGKEDEARGQLIRLLDYHEQEGTAYNGLVNHLIRETGLYPYLQLDTASWQDRFIYEAFKVNVGENQLFPLHREQSAVLKKLLDGKSLAISAPTSFGKSFIIDAFIALKKPKNVLIIVPTIALTDETRRRLHRKFAHEYKIITTTDVDLGEKNIFIFPQERAIYYAEKIEYLDLLIIDEFYKASEKFDKERSPSLIRAMMKLGGIAKQRYFLAPNISTMPDNPFTVGMEFLRLEFNTVFLEKKDLYKEINNDEIKKSEYLLEILTEQLGKTLVYAGTYSNIAKVANLLVDNLPVLTSELLSSFDSWLSKNYDKNWYLTNLVKRGVGVHNGQLHRSLTQIQVKLFEEHLGLDTLISTSSIIEGVNTCAQNIVIWRNRNGSSKLNDFTYRNIIGRGGRMFKHFVGNIYILEAPPNEEETQLDLTFPDQVLAGIDELRYGADLTREQFAKIKDYKDEMVELLGSDGLARVSAANGMQTCDFDMIRKISREMSTKPDVWAGIKFLNSKDVDTWDSSLYRIIRLQPGGWEIEYSKFISFIKVLSNNWICTIPQLLEMLDEFDLGIDDFFKLERNVTYKLGSLLNDVNLIGKEVFRNQAVDISSFATKISHAFLPSVVYQLEEYGLPRMISKKMHQGGIINFEDEEMTLHSAIDRLSNKGFNKISTDIPNLDSFDYYILRHFFEGISENQKI